MACKPARIRTVSFGFFVGRGIQRRMDAADQHNEIELNYVERGRLRLRHGARTVALSKGEAILYWAAIPHQVTAADAGTEISWLVVPLSRLLSWTPGARLFEGLLHGSVIPVGQDPRGGSLAPLLAGWAGDRASKTPEMNEILELEVQAFFRRLALAKGRPCRRPMAPEPGRAARMIRFITEHFAEPISVADIAAAAGLSPEYAMRLFRRSWGTTVWEFLLRHRVSQAQRLLVCGSDRVSDIALDCGFGSASRFYSAFARFCGVSPLAFRRKHREEAARGQRR